MLKARQGFTLIELLVVVVIIGLLAAIAIPRYGVVRQRAYVSTLAQDLRNLAVQQQLYYEKNAFEYAPDLDSLTDFEASEGVTVEIVQAEQRGWSARASHAAMDGIECVVFHGTADAIATSSGSASGTPGGAGIIGCDPI